MTVRDVQVAGRLVSRIGYGTMQLAGPAITGFPEDTDDAVALLKTAAQRGVQVFDTAWYYGPDITNRLVYRALFPYDSQLVIVSKLGNRRLPDGTWGTATTPHELQLACERDLRTLRIDSMPLTLLRWRPDRPGQVPFADAFGAVLELKAAGKIEHVGLSNVGVELLDAAIESGPVAAVSNAYSITERDDDLMVEVCTARDIPYLPYYPLSMGRIGLDPRVRSLGQQLGASPAQVALAWLLKRSVSIVPIPGTRTLRHLEDNLGAFDLGLPDEAVRSAFRPVSGPQ
jgi:aryl-alcohol dehydrogenase-like predicted oxidoreductase